MTTPAWERQSNGTDQLEIGDYRAVVERAPAGPGWIMVVERRNRIYRGFYEWAEIAWREHDDRDSACAAAEAILLECGALTAHELAEIARRRGMSKRPEWKAGKRGLVRLRAGDYIADAWPLASGAWLRIRHRDGGGYVDDALEPADDMDAARQWVEQWMLEIGALTAHDLAAMAREAAR